MIAVAVDERALARGLRYFDPYNSADEPWVLQLLAVKREIIAKCTPSPADLLRPWRCRENHAQVAAEILAHSLALNRAMQACGARQIGPDCYLSGLAGNVQQKL